MTMRQLNEYNHECSVQEQLAKAKEGDSVKETLVRFFAIQDSAKCEELGDVIEGDASEVFSSIVYDGTSTQFERDKRRVLGRAVNGCIQARYLGRCGASNTCSGKEAVASILQEVSLLNAPLEVNQV